MPAKKVRGTIHQGYPHFSDTYAGRQCTVIGLVALCFAYFNTGRQWTYNDVDNIVAEGHYRFVENLQNRNIPIRNVQHNEVPRYLHRFMGAEDIEVNLTSDLAYGVVGSVGSNQSGALDISTALNLCFVDHSFLLATFHEYTIALFYDSVRQTYALFDSHSCDSYGLTTANGAAILLEFQTLDALLSHLMRIYTQNQFEISAVTFSLPIVSAQQSSNTTNSMQNDHFSNSPSNNLSSLKTRTEEHVSNENLQNKEKYNIYQKLGVKDDAICDNNDSSRFAYPLSDPSSSSNASILFANPVEKETNFESSDNYEQEILFAYPIGNEKTYFESSDIYEQENFNQSASTHLQDIHACVPCHFVIIADHSYCTRNKDLSHTCSKQSSRQKDAKSSMEITLRDHNYCLENGHFNLSFEPTLNVGMPFEPFRNMHAHLLPECNSDKTGAENTNKNISNVKILLNKKYCDYIEMCPVYSCSVCQRFLFKNQVVHADVVSNLLNVAIGDTLCQWCKTGLKKGVCPLSILNNKLSTGSVPDVLCNLNLIEKRCISLINTFFTLVILPAFPVGQLGMTGLVVHLPLPVADFYRDMITNLQQNFACIFPSSYSVTPQIADLNKIRAALQWLSEHNPLYADVQIINDNANYVSGVSAREHINECIEMGAINTDYTMPSFFSYSNTDTYTLPIGQSFQNVADISHGEEKAFPTLFPYGCNGISEKRPVKLSHLQYYRSRLYNIDDRWRSNITYLLSSVGLYEKERLFQLISVYMRVKCQSSSLTAGNILTWNQNPDFLKNSYMFMKSIRGTAAYWKDVLYNLLAMIKNLGCPTFFMTLSANDYHWPELAQTLDVDIKDLPHAVKKHPLLTAIHFERRWRALLNNVLKGANSPLGHLRDYFARVEFQARGSPHIHMFLWIAGAPSLYTSSADEIITFIDSTISTTIPSKQQNPVLHDLVKRLQIHSHRSTCLRKSRCRFSFPQDPSNSTKIVSALDVIGKKKFYLTKRNEHETMVNAYNPTVLLHWQANMDIQMVNGPIGVAYYVCTYICKAEPNTLKSALAETIQNIQTSDPPPNMRSRLAKIGFCILKHRTLSAQEAAYRLGHLQLTWYSRQIVRITAVTPDKLCKRLKPQAALLQLPPDSTDIFETNIMDYYYYRPSVLHNLSLFGFARLWKVQKQVTKNQLAYKLSCSQPLFCVKRQQAAVVRVTKPSKATDDYYYSLLLLYLPHLNPADIIHPYTNFKEAFVHKHKLFDKDAVNVGYKLEEIESVVASLQLSNLESSSFCAPNTADTETEPVVLESHPGISDKHTTNSDFDIPNVDRISETETNLLEHHWHEISTGVNTKHFIENCQQLTNDQRRVLDFVKDNYRQSVFHIFVTGPGGVGKSFLIKTLVDYLTLATASLNGVVPVAVLAPTGVAAYNIKGQTIHSALKLPVQHDSAFSYCEPSAVVLKLLRQNFQHIHTVLIDEISMVSCSMLEFIHLRLQTIKNNDLPFGGLNMIVMGDFFQLRPVRGHFIFRHPLLWPLFLPFFLTQNVRQSSDNTFCQLLSRLRTGCSTNADVEMLKSRLVSDDTVDLNTLRIFPTLEQVRNHNLKVQHSLPYLLHTIYARHYFSERDNCPASAVDQSLIPVDDRDAGGLPAVLYVSQGTRIMLIRNLCVAYGLINGAQGCVTDIEVNSQTEEVQCIYVLFDDTSRLPRGLCFSDGSVQIPLYQQEFLSAGRFIVREMFPLIPCWAATVHKVQGLTLSAAVVSVDRSFFQHGQAYVALSRVQSLNGLYLTSLNIHKLTADPAVIKEYLRLHEKSTSHDI